LQKSDKARLIVNIIRFSFLVLAIIGISGCASLDFGYVSRVLIKRDSSTQDYQWKRSAKLIPALTTSPIQKRIDNKFVLAAFQEDPDVAKLEDYLDEGNTLALLILQNGRLIYEWYGEEHEASKPAAVFSISKSVVALLVARAVEAGEIDSLSTPLTHYLPELGARDRLFDQITLRDLIDMRSGIGFSQKVAFPWINQDAPAVYYASDLAATVQNRPVIVSPPGTFLYNDYAPNLMGLVLEKASGKSLVPGPMQSLWDDLQAEHDALWSIDNKGFAWHESGLVITARDLLRIGSLMLNNGRVGDRQVAPTQWGKQSLATDERGTATTFGELQVGYHDGWWTAHHESGQDDVFSMGRHGQIMLISPANNTVIVRLGRDGNAESNIAMTSRLRRVADRISQADNI